MLLRLTACNPDREDADHRQKDTAARQCHRQHDGHSLHLRNAAEGSNSQRGTGHNRTAVGLIQIGAHPGDITNVVAHVIRDRGGIAGIVFRDTSLNLTD